MLEVRLWCVPTLTPARAIFFAGKLQKDKMCLCKIPAVCEGQMISEVKAVLWGDSLTYFYSQCSHSTEKDWGLGHLVHSTVSKHISLAARGRARLEEERDNVLGEKCEVNAPDCHHIKIHLPVQRVVNLHQIWSHAGKGRGIQHFHGQQLHLNVKHTNWCPSDLWYVESFP